jgi:AmmeMemoRadiSam system protein A
MPLGAAVVQMAAAAATRDPRFGPVQPEEVDELSVELSVLSPFEPVAGIGEVETGRHGLMIRGRGRSGLLLPQVATQLGWDAGEFLAATCRKAGLPDQAWADPDVTVERFEAEVF